MKLIYTGTYRDLKTRAVTKEKAQTKPKNNINKAFADSLMKTYKTFTLQKVSVLNAQRLWPMLSSSKH